MQVKICSDILVDSTFAADRVSVKFGFNSNCSKDNYVLKQITFESNELWNKGLRHSSLLWCCRNYSRVPCYDDDDDYEYDDDGDDDVVVDDDDNSFYYPPAKCEPETS